MQSRAKSIFKELPSDNYEKQDDSGLSGESNKVLIMLRRCMEMAGILSFVCKRSCTSQEGQWGFIKMKIKVEKLIGCLWQASSGWRGLIVAANVRWKLWRYLLQTTSFSTILIRNQFWKMGQNRRKPYIQFLQETTVANFFLVIEFVNGTEKSLRSHLTEHFPFFCLNVSFSSERPNLQRPP